jgi:hypothetical protein
MPQEATQSVFGSLDLSGARQTVVAWPNIVAATIDDYRSFTALPHAFQKDAIQNSWDARKHRDGKGWKIVFHLLTDPKGKRFLTFTDSGTSGLTGRVLKSEEYEADLPIEERWGRFDSIAFTKAATEDSLGARGRGKLVFVGSSKEMGILYDTFREDGVYRLGCRQVQKTEFPVKSWEGADAKRELANISPSLPPLDQVGTRVIIPDPVDELVDAILDGSFERAIGETWWPIMSKAGAAIYIRTNGKERIVGIPSDLVFPEADDPKRLKVLKIDNAGFQYEGTLYRVKHIHIVCNMTGQVKEDIRGLSIYRSGMKVTSLPFKHVPKEFTESMYGYVEMDKDLDTDMKRAEHPSHYSFDFNRGLGRKLRIFLEDQLEKFAREKLGLGGDPKGAAKERQRNAELRALALINKAAKKLGLITQKGTVNPGGGGGGSKALPLRIEMPLPTFPRTEIRRIDFGERVTEIKASTVNDTDHAVVVRQTVYLVSESGKTDLSTKDLTIGPRSTSPIDGPMEVVFSKDRFPEGKYELRARIVALNSRDHKKGEIIDTAGHIFWLAQDPPLKTGLIEEIDPIPYPPDKAYIDGEAVPSKSGGIAYQYNVKHPGYERWGTGEEDLVDWLFRMMARDLVRVDARSEKPKLFTADDLETPEGVLRKSSETIGRLLAMYYE